MKTILLLIIAFALTGCTTVLTKDGMGVRLIESKENLECVSLGVVTGFDTMGATAGHECENATNEAKNKAALLGANAIRIINIQTTIQGTTVTVEALRCRFPEVPYWLPSGKDAPLKNPTI